MMVMKLVRFCRRIEREEKISDQASFDEISES